MLNSCFCYKGTGKWSSYYLADWTQAFLIKDPNPQPAGQS